MLAWSQTLENLQIPPTLTMEFDKDLAWYDIVCGKSEGNGRQRDHLIF
jgi:hypothetical protein